MRDEVPELAYEVLDRPGPQDRLLVLLHGYGEPTEALTDRLDRIDPGGRFRAVVPAAPFERRGRAIWHRALSAREEAEEQFLVSLAAVDALLGTVEDRLGLPAAEAVVGGFSQGGGLAIGLLLGADVRRRPAAGFGVCSFAPHIRGFRVDRAAARGRPLFLSSARDDHFASIHLSRGGAMALRDVGLSLAYAESDGGHEMTDEAADRIGGWLTAVDRGEAPASADHLLADADAEGRAEQLAAMWEVVSG